MCLLVFFEGGGRLYLFGENVFKKVNILGIFGQNLTSSLRVLNSVNVEWYLFKVNVNSQHYALFRKKVSDKFFVSSVYIKGIL